jgi:hypothetical protein
MTSPFELRNVRSITFRGVITGIELQLPHLAIASTIPPIPGGIEILVVAEDPLLRTTPNEPWIRVFCRVPNLAVFHSALVDAQSKSATFTGVIGEHVLAPPFGDGAISRKVVVGLESIVIEHDHFHLTRTDGHTQTIADFHVLMFAEPLEAGSVGPFQPADVGRSRQVEVALRFPSTPSVKSVPVFTECTDNRPQEELLYGTQQHIDAGFPVKRTTSQHAAIDHSVKPSTLNLRVATGTPGIDKGYYIAWYSLTHHEEFENLCHEDTCPDDDSVTCAYVGETRRGWLPSRVPGIAPGELMVDPRSSTSLLGVMFESLNQDYDHVVMFTDRGSTVRHCTSEDSRYEHPAFWRDEKIGKYPAPVEGILPDVLRFGWPGTITQRLSEAAFTGYNTLNPQFSYAHFFPGCSTPTNDMWTLNRPERDKQLSFHDPDTFARSQLDKSLEQHRWYAIRRLRYSATRRRDFSAIPVLLLGPHPKLRFDALPFLQKVSAQAIAIKAHYRFFAFSDATIGLDPAQKVLNGTNGWASGTVPAACTTLVWLAVHEVNDLAPQSVARIQLEGEREPTDTRPPALTSPSASHKRYLDGLYAYSVHERLVAAKTMHAGLFERVHKQIVREIDNQVGWLRFFGVLEAIGEALIVNPLLGAGTIDNGSPESRLRKQAHLAATNVSNQIVNMFATDNDAKALGGYEELWLNPRDGVSVSPSDMVECWDVHDNVANPNAANPNAAVNNDATIARIYGRSTSVARITPIEADIPLYVQTPTKGSAEVSGLVTRAVVQNGQTIQEAVKIGTVTLGQCDTRELDQDQPGRFRFHHAKPARYRLIAGSYVFESEYDSHFWWSSTPRDIVIVDGVDQHGFELELLPPVKIHHVAIELQLHIEDEGVFSDDRAEVNLRLDLDVIANGSPGISGIPIGLGSAFQRTPKPVGSGVHVYVFASIHLAGPIAVCLISVSLVDEEQQVWDGTANYSFEVPPNGPVQSITDANGPPLFICSDDFTSEWVKGDIFVQHTVSQPAQPVG